MNQKEINEQYERTLKDIENGLSESEQAEARSQYEEWKGSHSLPDMELAMFMSDKLEAITEIMHKSDKLRCVNGHVSRVVEKPESKEKEELRNEIDGLKGEIRELKELLINKLG